MAAGGGDIRGLALIGTAVAEMVVFALVGLWVDHRYGTEPWGVMVGATVGIAGGVGYLIYISRRSAGGGDPPPAGSNP